MISTYRAQLPIITSLKEKNCQKAKKVSFQYTALYKASKKNSPTSQEKEQIKKDAEARIKHYYQLEKEFNLTDCLAAESITIQKKYNINLSKDSTDLAKTADTFKESQPQIKIYER